MHPVTAAGRFSIELRQIFDSIEVFEEFQILDQVHILEKGEIKFSGSSDDVRGNEEILHRYLTI